MKIAVVAFDTRGGIQPYVALSLGLQRAGHDVRMITTAGFADLVTSHGVPLAATTGDTEAAVRQAGAVDQPFWGSRVAALGVGPAPLPRRRLTVENLGDALRRTVADRGMEQRARELGARIRAEDGVGEAVRVISTHWT